MAPNTQRKRTKTPAVGIKAPETAAWQTGTPVTIKDLKEGDTLVCNVAGGVFCTVVRLTGMQVLVETADGSRAWRFPAAPRRPATPST
jgi:hypothetical protein